MSSSFFLQQKDLKKTERRGECELSFRLVYIFSYNLFQFCGHTWILANTIARFLTFGQDAVADTFYSVGFVMSLCQLLSILELFHIADEIEKARLLPRFVQVMEKNLLLTMVIILEEIQSKPVVCVQLFLWNIQDLLRYPYELLCVMGTPSIAMLWTRYTLLIPLYILSVATEGVTIYQALPYVESAAPNSLNSTASTHIHLPFLLMVYLPVLALGASVTVWQLLKERQQQLEKWNKKIKRE
ncbi:very-long-chain (3R)-3-hydroxyacyl-CoA dehydratase 4 isoform X1 [Micropterus dolomieu]|uniref:very-long-chain (3R)-3-hydroxyacyl-CoA dehydratase 4 isoform X1 n=1 Tax=Micropterus dolomieu TaxID=147949 RepID=UPI001E8D7E70|nr:very-long-chain (3R)-3-hydroxyacyl-CoA dehydratase 4 isoform X1 [Micropterus dolomieu]